MSRSIPDYSLPRGILLALALAALAVLLGLFLYQVALVLLTVFAGILLAVLLDGLTGLTGRLLPLNRQIRLGLVIALMLIILVGFGWRIGPQFSEQLSQLAERVPEGLDQIRDQIRQWGIPLPSAAGSGQHLSLGKALLSHVSGVFSSALGVVTNLFVIAFVGIYLAVRPSHYIETVVHLVPAARHGRAHSVFRALGHALRLWLIGRFTSMSLVGILTAVGLLLLGVPLAISLGAIAALLSFVPYLGPILSVVPALLVAVLESPVLAGYVAILYLVVQLLESYLITPLIQSRAVSIPPAFLIIVQVMGGVLAGPMGVVLAAPVGISVAVIVQMLYVQDILGGTAHVPGAEHYDANTDQQQVV